MLTYREIEAAMAARGDEEVFYQGLYQACPNAFEQPIYSWQDFKGRFPGALPDKSPSTIKDVLTEEEFFANPDMQVNCFKNAKNAAAGTPFAASRRTRRTTVESTSGCG